VIVKECHALAVESTCKPHLHQIQQNKGKQYSISPLWSGRDYAKCADFWSKDHNVGFCV